MFHYECPNSPKNKKTNNLIEILKKIHPVISFNIIYLVEHLLSVIRHQI